MIACMCCISGLICHKHNHLLGTIQYSELPKHWYCRSTSKLVLWPILLTSYNCNSWIWISVQVQIRELQSPISWLTIVDCLQDWPQMTVKRSLGYLAFLVLKHFFKKWAILGLFFFSFSVFSNKQHKFQNKWMWKMSIQYLELGFELMTFKESPPLTRCCYHPYWSIFDWKIKVKIF